MQLANALPHHPPRTIALNRLAHSPADDEAIAIVRHSIRPRTQNHPPARNGASFLTQAGEIPGLAQAQLTRKHSSASTQLSAISS